MKRMKKVIQILIILLAFFSVTGFTNRRLTAKTVYHVYLKGESLGLIKSKDQLEKYIDKKQEEIKRQYNVDKVYIPTDLDIVKEITYSDDITSVEKIYNRIKDISPFTISGYEITIRGVDTQDHDGNVTKGKDQTIYVLDKKIFKDSVESTVKSFISKDDYSAYKEKKQKEIVDTGKLIEKIYIQNTITIKKTKIPINKTIYQTKESLSKYLLFATVEDQNKYTVQDGDTIEKISFNNKLSVEEFLIANPKITSEKSLLYPGQEVTLGIIKPQFNVVEEDHVVFNEEKNYSTETRYDNDQYVGYTETVQQGIKGENKVTQKIQKVNGETTNVVTVSTEVIKEPVTEIIVKGGKQANYSGGRYGNVIATAGSWGWPASCSSVSSGFGYRWGSFHDGVDIAGCGYGSNIFAAQAGVVVVSSAKAVNGQYIVIDHQNGYYTMYAHLCVGCRYVNEGDYVEKGQVIAGMGMTGAATGVHLHFALWQGYPYRGGTALNPLGVY